MIFFLGRCEPFFYQTLHSSQRTCFVTSKNQKHKSKKLLVTENIIQRGLPFLLPLIKLAVVSQSLDLIVGCGLSSQTTKTHIQSGHQISCCFLHLPSLSYFSVVFPRLDMIYLYYLLYCHILRYSVVLYFKLPLDWNASHLELIYDCHNLGK